MIKEYPVFITDAYPPLEYAGTVLCLQKNHKRYDYHVKYVSKALEFTFFNIYFPNQKTNMCLSYSLVWLPLKCARLLVGDYNGQFYCGGFYKMFLKKHFYDASLNFSDLISIQFLIV